MKVAGWVLVGSALLSLLSGALPFSILFGLVGWLLLRDNPKPEAPMPAAPPPLPRRSASPPALPAGPTLFSGIDTMAMGSGLNRRPAPEHDTRPPATVPHDTAVPPPPASDDVLDDLDRFLDASDS